MFADPVTITVNAVARVMARVSTNGTSSVYESADGNWKLSISHQIQNKRVRTLTRLDQRKIVADPLTAANDYEVFTTFTVSERPEVGFSQAEVEQQIVGYNTWLSTSANQVKLYGKES
jgi:hypothetical protein